MQKGVVETLGCMGGGGGVHVEVGHDVTSILKVESSLGTPILPFRILRATSVLLGKGTKFELQHGKMSTTKRRAIQILHISTFMFAYKCGYNDFISKYTDCNTDRFTSKWYLLQYLIRSFHM